MNTALCPPPSRADPVGSQSAGPDESFHRDKRGDRLPIGKPVIHGYRGTRRGFWQAGAGYEFMAGQLS